MATSRTFEGSELAVVLAAVHRELGDHATIVSAERRRRGGVAGFFAKECFEVVATAADEHAGGAVVVDTADPVAALLGLADATSARERAASPATAPSPAPPLVADRGPAPAVEAPTLAAALALSDPGGEPDFLAALARALDPVPAPAAPVFSELFARAQLLAPIPVPPPLSPTVEAPRPGPTPTAEDGARSAGQVLPRTPAPAPVPPRRVEPRVRPAFTDAPRLRRVAAAPALSSTTRGVVVVAGPAGDAYARACALATGLGLDAGEVLVAQEDRPSVAVPAWQWLRRPDEVDARRARWADRGRPVIVALALPMEGLEATWAAAMAAALRPVALQLIGEGEAEATVASVIPEAPAGGSRPMPARWSQRQDGRQLSGTA